MDRTAFELIMCIGGRSSIVNQTLPSPALDVFNPPGPARGRVGLATLAQFAWPMLECGDDQ